MVEPEDFTDIAGPAEGLHQGVKVERIGFWGFDAGFWSRIRLGFRESPRKLGDSVEELIAGVIFVRFRRREPFVGKGGAGCRTMAPDGSAATPRLVVYRIDQKV